ncbi:RAM signaling pathway protein-domain-containing protein [Podospora didyma]|uniref:RAM signaling pathway protein-domain-containing protein n=1 Tax=Podospora didyma TaxID=330526 RepID=A0AAE0P4J6_9PEZI|nr:RAM signaling pathway protein-domain-containing protein [Podospora didyma]
MDWKGAQQQQQSLGRRPPEPLVQGQGMIASRRIPPPQPPQPPAQPRGVSPGVVAATAPLSPGQIITLVREARKKALVDGESRPAEPDGLKPGITLDLIRKNIPALPEEVIDILRNGVERLALSHNALVSLPSRFSRCTSLRYLAARNNAFEVFPLPICDLTSLEFLDLSRNRLKELPPEIAKLTSLKAFAVQYNQIESLPLSLADMTALQRLKLDGNAIKFPPKEILQRPKTVPPNEILSEGEVVEIMVTDQIKKFLAQRLSGASESEGGDDESSEGADTPRLPARRAGSRFPIRVKGSGASALSPPMSRSPSLSRPPPIPGRSLSQYNISARKQGIIPLTMGKSNESLRSNPELTRTHPDEERSESRSSSRPSGPSAENATPSAAESNAVVATGPKANRSSTHFRGFSYSGGLTLLSPEDSSLQRPLYVRELSALPVRQYQFRAVDPVLEVAKGILYSIFQIHLGVQTLMSLTNDGDARRSSLEMVFYNTNVYFEELEQAIQDYDLAAGTRAATREHEGMQRAYSTLIHAYVHICSRLISSVDLLVDNGDHRYLRTFLMLVYHSIMELRVAIGGWLSREGAAAEPVSTTRNPSPSRTINKETTSRRLGSVTPGRIRTDIPYTGTTTRRAAIQATRTPPSSDSFTSAVSSTDGGRQGSGKPQQPDLPSSDGDSQFERFYVSLKNASELIKRAMPELNSLFTNGLRNARLPEATEKWELLLNKSATVMQQTELLQGRLLTLRLRDPGLGARSPFWTLCSNLFSSWADLGHQIKLAHVEKLVVRFPGDTVEVLRQISRGMKESIDLMVIVRKQAAASSMSGSVVSSSSHFSSPGGQALPMTPQSAALGPAVIRATKPFSPP